MHINLICREPRFTIEMREPSYPYGIELISLDAMGNVMETLIHD